MLKIFRAVETNKTDIAELFDQYRVFYNMKSDISSATHFISERLKLKDSILYLAQNGNETYGFIQIYPVFSSIAMKPVWILNDLFVKKDHRNKGYAKALMRQVEVDAKNENIFSIKLSTAIKNIKAKKLYQSIKYKKIGNFEYYSLKI